MGRWPIIRTDRLIDRYFDEIYVSAYSPVYLFHVHDKILILDFGSQYTQLIARRVRALHIYAEIHRYDLSDAFIRNFAPRGIFLSGGRHRSPARIRRARRRRCLSLACRCSAFATVCKRWPRNSAVKSSMARAASSAIRMYIYTRARIGSAGSRKNRAMQIVKRLPYG